MNQSNCKGENVRAGTRRQVCRRVPASIAVEQGGIHSLYASSLDPFHPFLEPLPIQFVIPFHFSGSALTPAPKSIPGRTNGRRVW